MNGWELAACIAGIWLVMGLAVGLVIGPTLKNRRELDTRPADDGRQDDDRD